MKSIGIDIGSTATKAAVVEDDQVIDTLLMPTGFSSVDAAERVASALAERGFDLEDASSFPCRYNYRFSVFVIAAIVVVFPWSM